MFNSWPDKLWTNRFGFESFMNSVYAMMSSSKSRTITRCRDLNGCSHVSRAITHLVIGSQFTRNYANVYVRSLRVHLFLRAHDDSCLDHWCFLRSVAENGNFFTPNVLTWVFCSLSLQPEYEHKHRYKASLYLVFLSLFSCFWQVCLFVLSLTALFKNFVIFMLIISALETALRYWGLQTPCERDFK